MSINCANQCYHIGGPWISYDPDCPVHGTDARAQRERDEARQYDLDALVKEVGALRDGALAGQDLRAYVDAVDNLISHLSNR